MTLRQDRRDGTEDRMLRRMAALAALVALAGCGVSSPHAINSMMAAGELRAAPHATDPGLFVVHLSAHDWTPVLERLETQEEVVAAMLGGQCGQTSIEDRRVTQFGQTPLGTQRRLYTLTVRCPNGATRAAERG
jgi:hypothetical protein